MRILTEVSEGSGGSPSRSVAILDAGHLKQLFGHRSRHNASSARSRNQPHQDGAALSGYFARNSVGFADLVAPESPPHGYNAQLGKDDGTPDSRGDLFRALDAQTHVAVVVTDSHKGLEASALTGASLLLDWHDLEHLVFEGRSKEKVDDFELLSDKRKRVRMLWRYSPERSASSPDSIRTQVDFT